MSEAFEYILPSVQTYSWGVCGEKSLAGVLWNNIQKLHKKKISEKNQFSASTPYAEIWYGTHSNGINYILQETESEENCELKTETTLVQYLSSRRNSYKIPENAKNLLPYLLKILCSCKALSIQCHPDQKTASKFHSKYPEEFPDKNCKPEIAIALSDPVNALCGYRGWDAIAKNFIELPELQSLFEEKWIEAHYSAFNNTKTVSQEVAESLTRTITKTFLDAKSSQVEILISKLLDRVEEYQNNNIVEKAEICKSLYFFKKLYDDYGVDPGCLMPFILNCFSLKPGEGLYIPENTLHAYLQGQMIECMACSDNIIRGGLTSKRKNLQLLYEVLNYAPYTIPFVQPEKIDFANSHFSFADAFIYNVNVKDFCVYVLRMAVNGVIKNLSIKGQAPSIFVVLTGSVTATIKKKDGTIQTSSELVQGKAIVIAPGHNLTLRHNVQTKSVNDELKNEPFVQLAELLNPKATSNFFGVLATGSFD